MLDTNRTDISWTGGNISEEMKKLIKMLCGKQENIALNVRVLNVCLQDEKGTTWLLII